MTIILSYCRPTQLHTTTGAPLVQVWGKALKLI